jgi:hypothetical protein
MNKDQLKAMGVLNLFFQLFAMFLILCPEGLGSSELDHVSQQTSNRMAVVVISIAVVAIGLERLRKWAVMYFSLASALASSWLLFESFTAVTFPVNFFYLTLAGLFIVPTVLFVRNWTHLSWGGRWFF